MGLDRNLRCLRVDRIEDINRLQAKATILWAVLQSTRVMKGFIDAKFRGHPLIIKAISLFLLTERVDPQNLKDLMRSQASKPKLLCFSC